MKLFFPKMATANQSVNLIHFFKKMKVPLYVALGTALRDIKQLHLETLPTPADANYYINTNTRTHKYHAVISCMEQVSSTQKVNNMQFHRFSFFLSFFLF